MKRKRIGAVTLLENRAGHFCLAVDKAMSSGDLKTLTLALDRREARAALRLLHSALLTEGRHG